MASRLEQLQSFYESDPTDPFNIYALAIEFLNVEPTRSIKLFDQLLLEHPTYLPTYYHAAKLQQEAGNASRAQQIFEAGIALAKSTNQSKALRELQSAYQEMMDE